MYQMKVAAYAAFVFVCLFLFASGNSGQGLQAQTGPTSYHCHVLIGDAKTVYSSPLVATNMAFGTLQGDWRKYMQATYSMPAGNPRFECLDFGRLPSQQQFSLSYEEKGWSNYKIIHVDYAPGIAPAASGRTVPAASTLPVTPATSSSGPTIRAYMSCSTAVAGGLDVYYTGVFAAELPPATRKIPQGFSVDRQPVNPASVQEILNHFQAYLTQKGYKYAPGMAVACDLMSTEAAARAAQHKRAYEGGGCSSGCGKIIETGWKNN